MVPQDPFDPETFDLGSSLAYLLVRARNTLSQGLEQEVSQMGMTHAQACCLMMLAGGHAATPGDVARHLNTDAGAVTRLLDRMERRGLIARRRGEADRRVVYLTLTDEGSAMVRNLPAVFCDVMRRSFAGFSAGEIAVLRELLQKVVANGVGAG
ncbi:DNA-binding MarR family transcriptional regulator [Cupriavidus agavae]|uniref:DNA-binding MarR family transcriptional regulator n=1 Tax=Cupriavidus agavae TaxID=1001822 RepID=A0A4Q7RAR0_9BURK|nr:DNA-binding MarR family transcriptional regulator [Cupriavidus agavae]